MADEPTSTRPSASPPAGRAGPPSGRRRAQRAGPPAGSPARPLRSDDVRESPEVRGPVIRAGVGAVPAVWED